MWSSAAPPAAARTARYSSLPSTRCPAATGTGFPLSWCREPIVVWPRFYPLLSDKVTAVPDDLRDQLDLAARFCVVSGVATMISIVFLAAGGWWLTAAAVTLAGSLLSYRAALAAAAAYGQALEAAFDLHRFDLLTALHLPLPANLVGEVTANQELSRFLRQPSG